MLLLLTICIVMIEMMASMRFNVWKHDGTRGTFTIEEGEYTVQEILEKVYGKNIDVDMYWLMHHDKVYSNSNDRLPFLSEDSQVTFWVTESRQVQDFELVFPSDELKTFQISTPLSNHVRVDTLLSMHQFDPSKYCLFGEEAGVKYCGDYRVSGPQRFVIGPMDATPSGDEYPLVVNIGGKQISIEMPVDGTAADLLRLATAGIYPPTGGYRVHYAGEMIPMGAALSDFGVGAEAQVDTIRVQIADILIESKRRDRGCDQSTIDLMRLECHVASNTIWLNGKELVNPTFIQRDGMSQINHGSGDREEMKIFRFVGYDNEMRMRECLSKFK